MKKLFALTLVCAMAFSLAAPAAAASWGSGGSTSTVTGAPYSVTVTQLPPEGGTGTYNASSVTAGSPVRFKVVFTIPSNEALAAYYGLTSLPAGVQQASVTVENITNLNEAEDRDNISGFVSSNAVRINEMPANGTYSVTYTGTVAGTGNASVKAALSYAQVMPHYSEGGLVRKINNTTYTIYEIGIAAGTPNTMDFRRLIFPVAGNGLVDKSTWSFTLGFDTYSVISNGRAYLSSSSQVLDDASDAGYTQLVNAYNELTGVLGFRQGDTAYYTAANILASFGFSAGVSDAKTYAAYGSSLTVTDNTSVPNTGGELSLFGFALTGLALLAAAAVTVKRVRSK